MMKLIKRLIRRLKSLKIISKLFKIKKMANQKSYNEGLNTPNTLALPITGTDIKVAYETQGGVGVAIVSSSDVVHPSKQLEDILEGQGIDTSDSANIDAAIEAMPEAVAKGFLKQQTNGILFSDY